MKSLIHKTIVIFLFGLISCSLKAQVVVGLMPGAGMARFARNQDFRSPVDWSEKRGFDFVRTVSVEARFGTDKWDKIAIQPIIGYRLMHFGAFDEQTRDAYSWTRRKGEYDLYWHGFTGGMQFTMRAFSLGKGSLWPFIRGGGTAYFGSVEVQKEEITSFLSPETPRLYEKKDSGALNESSSSLGLNGAIGIRYLIPLRDMNIFVFSSAELMHVDLTYEKAFFKYGWMYGLNLGLEIEPFKRKTKK